MGRSDKAKKTVSFLLAEGQKRLDRPRSELDFSIEDPLAVALINNIENFPHIFVLCCIMDRQIKAARAWHAPCKVANLIGGPEFDRFAKLKLKTIRQIFQKEKLHRFSGMADIFHSAIQDIKLKYGGNAARIWDGKPESAAVIRRFLEFSGVGIKIANMAVTILVRDFKIPMSSYSSIDIAPDVRVMRFFKHHKLLRAEGTTQELIYLARELHPPFPGLLDYGAWKWLPGQDIFNTAGPVDN